MLSITYTMFTAFKLRSYLSFSVPKSRFAKGSRLGSSIMCRNRTSLVSCRGRVDRRKFTGTRATLDEAFNRLLATRCDVHKKGRKGVPNNRTCRCRFDLKISGCTKCLYLPRGFSNHVTSACCMGESFGSNPGNSFAVAGGGLAPVLGRPSVSSVPRVGTVTLLLCSCTSRRVTSVCKPFPCVGCGRGGRRRPFACGALSRVCTAVISGVSAVSTYFGRCPRHPR